jgi:hypothetical protein
VPAGFANMCDKCGKVVFVNSQPGYNDLEPGWIRVYLEDGKDMMFCSRQHAADYLSPS